MPNILHLDLHGFFVAVERLLDPSLRGRPVVIGGRPDTWGRVVAASNEAERKGVHAGLSLAVAASRCPGAAFVEGSVDRYLDVSAAVDELVRELGVPVEWEGIDSVFLALDGTASRLGPSRTIAEHLQGQVARRFGIDVACGLAGSRTSAQVASRLSRPRGLLYVLPGYEERFLAPLDVGYLPDLATGTRRKLLEAGLLTLGALGRLDATVARELLGPFGPRFVERARGMDARPIDGTRPPRSLRRTVTFTDAIEDEAGLAGILDHAAASLGRRLRQGGWFAQRVTLRVQPAHATQAESRSLDLSEPTASDEVIAAAARRLLAVVGLRARSTSWPVSGVGLVLSTLRAAERQIPLFRRTG
jgi:DNA polymerase-4